MIFERHANLKYKYGNRHFWCRGYYVDTVGKNAKKIEEYIKNQIQEDLAYEQMSLKEYIDPFTGEPVKKAKNKAPLGAVREKMRLANLFSVRIAQPAIKPYRASKPPVLRVVMI